MSLSSQQRSRLTVVRFLAPLACGAFALAACERGVDGSRQLDCAFDRVLGSDDAPCVCDETVVEATALVGECACRTTGFECFDPGDCEVREVWDGSDLWDALPGFGSNYGPYTTGPMPITVDLVAATPLEIDASAFCEVGSNCQPVRFLQGAYVAGVTLEGDDDFYMFPGFKMILRVEAGTRFRLRSFYLDIHPTPFWNFAPVAETALPCLQPCEPGQARCPTDRVCYAAGRGYCFGCTTVGVEVCACQTADGPEPDGTYCNFWISGDQAAVGECQQGVCEADYY